MVMHVLELSPPNTGGMLAPVALDLSTAVAAQAGLHLVTASKVSQLTLNDTHERMAVSFEGCPGVAVFGICTFPTQRFFLVGFVWGPPGSVPRSISFKPYFERGALLCAVFEDIHAETVARTSIRFVPMYF